MAMKQKLNDFDLGAVSGGVAICNDWGDGSVYKIGKNGEAFTHTFNASDFDNVAAIVSQTYDPSLEDADNEENIMNALINSPYLSPL